MGSEIKVMRYGFILLIVASGYAGYIDFGSGGKYDFLWDGSVMLASTLGLIFSREIYRYL